MVRALFAVASVLQPAVIFIDEIDSVLSARKAEGSPAVRPLLVCFSFFSLADLWSRSFLPSFPAIPRREWSADKHGTA